MENFSQEKNEEGVSPAIPTIPITSAIPDDSDIQFEEIIDVDKIQKELRQQFGDGSEDDEMISDSSIGQYDSNLVEQDATDDSMVLEKRKKEKEALRLEVDPKDKKYVVYIDYNNIEFMEDLSPMERKDMINNVLREQHAYRTKKRVLDERNRFIKHAIVATLTFIIGFPLLFLCVNKGVEYTMQNYKDAKINFEKLYNSHGKVQSGIPSAAARFKY